MKKVRNIHPGEILKKEFLLPLRITKYRLSKETGMLQTKIAAIVKGRKRITPATALKLARYFGNSPRFWLDLQKDFDMRRRNPG